MSAVSLVGGPDAVTACPPIQTNVQIMREGFEPELFEQVMAGLEEDCNRCEIFEGFNELPNILTKPRSCLNCPHACLLLLSIPSADLPRLAEAFAAAEGNPHDIPVLVYFSDQSPEFDISSLPPQIDDFLLYPLNVRDLRLRIRRVMKRFRAREDELSQVKMNLISYLGMRQFIGQSPAFVAEISKIPRVAPCDATVLLIGDTGTGKEMCARAIHYLSPRAPQPMIPINCGSIPADLFENEMFGHEPGAFTDARRPRRGIVAEAEGGTLFLDEVDSLPPQAQIKLLRFLQDQQYRPLGASSYRQANVRVIAASNQNLRDKVRAGTFREDLYYRLKVVSLHLPQLRERHEDILPLAAHFLKTAATQYKCRVTDFSPGAEQRLLSYDWPGNVRELENVVRQAVVMSPGELIRASDLQLGSDAQSEARRPSRRESLKAAKSRVIEEFERNYLSEVLDECGGNISRAARAAQKDRRTFFGLLKKYNLIAGPMIYDEHDEHQGETAH
ncbi:MAG TPA: sigma-54 dependent transcriptional regulator [Pyrinomonadaceae bacterium]